MHKLLPPVWILVLAFLIAAQEPPDLKDYEQIGRDDKIMYFVNTQDIIRHNPRFRTVKVLAAHYRMEPDGVKYALNNIAYIISTYRVDCRERSGMRMKDEGKWPTKNETVETISRIYKNPKPDKPKKSRKLWFAIDAVCGDTSPELQSKAYKWTGGNGCNLIGGGDAEKPCCAAHDKIYRTGGGFRAKWQADSELFKCIWKRNKLLAPFTFVGTNVGGLIAFHWGKKRRLDPPVTAAQEGAAWNQLSAIQNLPTEPTWSQ